MTMNFSNAAFESAEPVTRKLIADQFPHWMRERSACGVVIVAAADGKPSRRITNMALEAGNHLSHRGAVAADGKTGDGAGNVSGIPQKLFHKSLLQVGVRATAENVAVGQFFMPHDPTAQEEIQKIIEDNLIKTGFKPLMWRDTPLDADALGDIALKSMPAIKQIVFEPINTNNAGRDLFVASRGITKAAKAMGADEFYICSLSTKIINYKGMILAENLPQFYLDFQDPDFETPFCILHQRYSTNTNPSWPRAQPYATINSALAHNGEINTLNGNVNFVSSVEKLLVDLGLQDERDSILPLIDVAGSDSSQLNDLYGYLVDVLGIDATAVINAMIPAVHGNHAFMPAWDGPAAIAFTNGDSKIGMHADRSGLRPTRYTITNDNILVAGSEAGMVHLDPKTVVRRGQLGPGETLLVDMKQHRIVYPDEIRTQLPTATQVKYITFSRVTEEATSALPTTRALQKQQYAAGYTSEEMKAIKSLATTGEELISSMGDDTKTSGLEEWHDLPVMGTSYKPLHHLARQAFAQVTNPPIDPLRERNVMNLDVYLKRPSLADIEKSDTEALALKSPVVTGNELRDLRTRFGYGAIAEIDATFRVNDNPDDPDNYRALEIALDRIVAEADEAYNKGQRHFVISDEMIAQNKFGVPMMLAVSVINKHFISRGVRSDVALHARAAEVMDTHGLAMMLAAGATTVNPYVAFRTIQNEVRAGRFKKVATIGGEKKLVNLTLEEAVANYKKGMDKGLLKIMSKMGIGVLASYTGGYNFEMLGLGNDVVDRYMPGVVSRIGGYSLADLQLGIMRIHDEAEQHASMGRTHLLIGDRHRTIPGAEHKHANNTAIRIFREAVVSGNYDQYRNFARAALKASDIDPTHTDPELRQDPARRPHNLRDLVGIRRLDGKGFIENPIISTEHPVIPASVESVADIVKRYNTGAMSLGALSPEAHATLTKAMNSIGAKSDCGEGGEFNDGDISKIRQIASGRFGVTAEYLAHADIEELEIKVAQGAKPGEGGQLPGMKVSGLIAKLRHSTQGVTLISPPPHHDIYSIEDLAQLIYDLKQINPKAKITVKLVAQSGIGTIASGVAKAGADVIHVSGNSGGTGASPETSLYHAGSPVELGVAEVHQQLVEDGLRERVLIRADGGLKTALDNLKIHMHGADEVGFGTQALIAEGCVMAGVCHENTCPAGVATADEALRKKFSGEPEHVINYMKFMAQETREYLAAMGANFVAEIIGRTDLLQQVDFPNRISLHRELAAPSTTKVNRLNPNMGRFAVPDTLDQRLLNSQGYTLSEIKGQLKEGERVVYEDNVFNTDRSVGAHLSGQLVREFGPKSLYPSQFTLNLTGSAGQSFGFAAVQGLELRVTGEVNDYVGKSLSGARIIIQPYAHERDRREQAIVGNTALYGATGGKLFAAGRAGERFGVRNSGAKTVVEGCGNNGCEYMTGGRVVVLGSVGDNFAAGMSGGEAFVYDPNNTFHSKVNEGTVVVYNVTNPEWQKKLKRLVVEHHGATNSCVAEELLNNWDEAIGHFRMVLGRDMLPRYPEMLNPVLAPQLDAA